MGTYSDNLSNRLRHHYGKITLKSHGKDVIHPDKGKFLGRCNRTACQSPGAYFFNFSTRAYYCGACARDINEFHLREYNTPLLVPVRDENEKEETEKINFTKSQRRKDGRAY